MSSSKDTKPIPLPDTIRAGILDHIPLGIIVIDANYRIVYENKEMLRLLGVPAGESTPMLGANLFEIENLKSSGAGSVLKNMLKEKNIGSMRVIRYKSVLGQDCECRVTSDTINSHFVFFAQDMSKEARLKRHSKNLYTAVEQSATLVIITDEEGYITYTNPAFREVTGYTPTELQGKTPRVLKSGVLDDSVYTDLWKTIQGGDSWSGEFLNIAKNGTTFWVRATISPVINGGGKIVGYVGVQEDITEDKLLAEEILRQEESYRRVFENSLAAMALHKLVRDDQGKPVDYRFIRANRAFYLHTGLEDKVDGKLVSEAIPGVLEDSVDWLGSYSRVCLTGEAWHEVSIYSSVMGRHYDVIAFRTGRDEFATSFLEVSDRISYQERMLELETAKANFLAAATHEIRTPVTIVSGLHEVLAEMAVDWTDQARGLVNQITIQVQNISRIVDDSLELSRLETDPDSLTESMSMVNVSYLAFMVKEKISERAKAKGINLIANTDDLQLVVYGNESLLRRMIYNLLDNAVKFTDEGGQVNLQVHRKKDMVQIRVSDDGIGISQADQNRIWERFFQVDQSSVRKYRGIGMGLAIVKSVAIFHGGSVEVESQLEVGSVFTVYLPANGERVK